MVFGAHGRQFNGNMCISLILLIQCLPFMCYKLKEILQDTKKIFLKYFFLKIFTLGFLQERLRLLRKSLYFFIVNPDSLVPSSKYYHGTNVWLTFRLMIYFNCNNSHEAIILASKYLQHVLRL